MDTLRTHELKVVLLCFLRFENMMNLNIFKIIFLSFTLPLELVEAEDIKLNKF